MNYSDGFHNLTLGIALILANNCSKRYDCYDNEDPRTAPLAREGNFSCNEELQRYLYQQDEMADKTIVH